MASVHLSLSAYLTCFQLISALLLGPSLVVRVDAQNRSDEVRALLSFKEVNTAALPPTQTRGYWSSWKESDENACAWLGVICTDNYTVWELDFSGWGFSLPMNLGVLANLANLRRLDLSSNNLNHIPEDIGNLTGLTELDLSRSHLGAGIPQSILVCKKLRSLFLQENELSGEILSLSDLVNLQYVNFAHNQFSGPFPKGLGELSSLSIVDFSSNSLSGNIPALPNLTNLIDLKLNNNNFTGFEVPWFLGGNSSLQKISVSFNQLGGMIPSGIANIPNLEALDMSHNQLSGNIPFGFSLLNSNPSGFSLDLSQNQLTGNIPPDLLQQSGNSPSCSAINLSHNVLNGSIPIDGTKYSCFNTLDLSHNNLSGQIPWNIFSDEASSIWRLWLQNNRLSGDIVDVILEGPGIQSTTELKLQNNFFTGDLSRIANSNFTTGLQVLDLSNNDLRWSASKTIPDPIRVTLERLIASGSPLTEIQVAGNDFSGTYLPITCFADHSTEYIQVLDLSNNHLKGEISDAAFNDSCLPRLEFLNLSNNDLTGSVRESIVILPYLAVLDVSNNDLSGPLPALPFKSRLVNPSFFAGNPQLCGYPLPSCPLPRSGGIRWWLLFIIVNISATTAVGSCALATWQLRVYRRRHQQDADLIKTLMDRDSATLMPLQELKKATRNFAKSAQIGDGGFGTVYMGKLNNGTIVAIKRSKREGSENDKERFLNEVRVLSHVNHRNLVKLLGCCMENKIALLVFEFVSNGTLEEHLQGKIGAVGLSWKQRLNIALQSADALNYLHSGARFPVYHRDVKSANILLDDNLNAKVADFGISRLAPMKATHVSTIGMGTMGYVDPECWTSFQLNDKSDVYSFGVVLLELISAQRAVDLRRGGEEKSLVIFANPLIKSGDLQGLVDPALMETFNDQAGQERKSILNVGRLAIKCLNMPSKARPSMKEVWKELQNLWVELSGTSTYLDSINVDSHQDPQSDHMIKFSESVSRRSSGFTTRSHASRIQISQVPHRRSCDF